MERLTRRTWRRVGAGLSVMMLGGAAPLSAQTAAAAIESKAYAPPIGRLSFHVNTATFEGSAGDRWSDAELWTGIELHTPDVAGPGVEFGVDVRYSLYPGTRRERRLSAYDGYVGLRLGDSGQLRLRAGHMWIPELGSVGAVAGGLVEAQLPGDEDGYRVRVGGFSGLEPEIYDAGYASGVRKYGGFMGIQRGFRQRHLLGYTLVRQGSFTERSVLTTTNYVPVGQSVFVYQAAEVDLQGPADGVAPAGLSYFLANARITASPRVELHANYNRGRALDARTLTDDIRNGRLVPAQAVDGWRYQSAGARATVEVLPGVRAYIGYARDRNNRDEAAMDRLMAGGHAGNVLASGFDLSASVSRSERAVGPYYSSFVSLGHGLGRDWYVSADYASSLAVIRLRGDSGIVLESRPATHRLSGTASATVARNVSLLCTIDYTRDAGARDIRLLTGASVKLR